MKVIRPGKGETISIELEEDVLKRNREIAEENRKLLDYYGVFGVDVMGSVGSGKTSIIIALSSFLEGKRIAIICGDTETAIDAELISSRGLSSLQINTGRECHLDAPIVKKALSFLDLSKIDILFIENVGNIICPSEFPLGTHKRIVVLSITEGPYTVLKHPFVFLNADIVAINKIDLKHVVDVDPDMLEAQIRRIRPNISVVKTSCKSGEGIGELKRALGL